MKTTMIFITIFTAFATIACLVICVIAEISLFWTLAITFATCFYHFAIRLVVGYSIAAIFHNDKWNYNSYWFQQKGFETKIYKILYVKKWKQNIPTYNPLEFDIRNHGLDYVTRATCQAEVVHEVNVIVSFIPIIFSLWVGALPVFAITSFCAALYDLMFVVLQRYNRPRLIKLLKVKDKIG
ncbi:MAG: hypothetical protein LUI12_09280 [Clostridiales bacterium]|nr:hypothetical protein [Clostridiales bacterium]